MAIIATRNQSFSRDLDVRINISLAQTELAQDLSVPVFVTGNAPFSHGAGRVKFYSSLEGVQSDFAADSEAMKAASAFFAQELRPSTMAIAKAFGDPQIAFLTSGEVGELAAFQAVDNGSFKISIDGEENDITALDFTGANTLADVAGVVQAGLQAVAEGGFNGATVTIENGLMTVKSGTSGDSSRVSTLAALVSGTDVSGLGYLNARDDIATITDGYTPTGIVQELGLVEQAARASGKFIFGWALDKFYRDTDAQVEASLWAQARTAHMVLVSNSPAALDPQVSSDIGSQISERGDRQTTLIWSDAPSEYPDMALLALALSVDYDAPESTLTLKFKNLNSVTPISVDEVALITLQGKQYNTLTRVGEVARTVRDGVVALAPYFTDSIINVTNLKERMQVAVFNVFLRNKKVGYTEGGVALIRAAIEQVCELFVDNGTLASRRVADNTRQSGSRVEPAYEIENTPLRLMTMDQRAQRAGPPFRVIAREAGAIHSVNISIEVES